MLNHNVFIITHSFCNKNTFISFITFTLLGMLVYKFSDQHLYHGTEMTTRTLPVFVKNVFNIILAFRIDVHYFHVLLLALYYIQYSLVELLVN